MARPRIICEETVAETRYVAIGVDGRALSIFVSRDWERPCLSVGSVHDGRLRAIAMAQGGGFIDIAGFPGGFLRLAPGHRLTEGAKVHVKTMSEAHDDKGARLELAAPGDSGLDPVEAWRLSLPGFDEARIAATPVGDAVVEAAFEEALAPSVTMPGGGRLTLERTRALTAVDIDTAGRLGSGTAAARASAVNVAAARELARQLELRQIGGLIVLDCIAPLTRETGIAVRDVFQAAHSTVSHRRVRTLAPSSLGLMEMALEWGRRPIAGHYKDEAMAAALAGLRALESAAILAPMARLTLDLPASAHAWIETAPVDFKARLDARFGARLTLAVSAKAKPEVYIAP